MKNIQDLLTFKNTERRFNAFQTPFCRFMVIIYPALDIVAISILKSQLVAFKFNVDTKRAFAVLCKHDIRSISVSYVRLRAANISRI